jgi:hypothetical protein
VGAQGATGARGPTGAQGARGPTGPGGPPGGTGLPGVTGFPGVPGGTGPQGAQGFSSGPGATGAQGAKGPQGAQGFEGETCHEFFINCGRDCGEACGGDPATAIYSLCPALINTCQTFTDAGCTTTCFCGNNYISDGLNCWFVNSAGGCFLDQEEPCASDARVKTNVQTLSNSLDKLLQLQPVEFDWKEITPQYDWFVENGITHSIGFIAQEVKQLIPEIVILKDNGYYTIDYPKINALLVEGIKEQQVFIDEVENDIIYLEKYFNI